MFAMERWYPPEKKRIILSVKAIESIWASPVAQKILRVVKTAGDFEEAEFINLVNGLFKDHYDVLKICIFNEKNLPKILSKQYGIAQKHHSLISYLICLPKNADFVDAIVGFVDMYADLYLHPENWEQPVKVPLNEYLKEVNRTPDDIQSIQISFIRHFPRYLLDLIRNWRFQYRMVLKDEAEQQAKSRKAF